LAAIPLVLLVWFAVGCGAGGFQDPGARSKRMNALKAIGLSYHNYFDKYKRGPTKPADLREFQADFPEANQLLEDGSLEVVWGIHLMRQPQGLTNTVLAFEKTAESSGSRLVLMGDGAVRQMDEAEFRKARQVAPSP
jgi:hypothetical protein